MRVKFYLRELRAKASPEDSSEKSVAPEESSTTKQRTSARRRTAATAVIASVNFGPHRLKLGTGISILPRFWNAERGRAKRGYAHEVVVNNQLNAFEAFVIAEHGRLLAEKQLTPQRLKECVRQQKVKAARVPTVLETLDAFIEDSATLLQPRTLMIYRTVKKQLEGFIAAYGVKLTWESLNLLFFQKFTEYLVRIQGLNNTTLDKTLQRLRAFLRHCDEVREIPMCRDYQRFTKKMLPKGEQSRKVYLTHEELGRIEALDLSLDARLRRVRDLFLFLCHVGVRFSDAQSLRTEHYKGETLEIVTQKNRKRVRIPLHPMAQRIWKLYKGELPAISNQKFNEYLKEICKTAGIDEPTAVVDFTGAERREKTVPKYELIGAHTAKRTFVTNLLLSGVSVESLCEITGNTPTTLQKYMVPTGEDVRRELKAAWK